MTSLDAFSSLPSEDPWHNANVHQTNTQNHNPPVTPYESGSDLRIPASSIPISNPHAIINGSSVLNSLFGDEDDDDENDDDDQIDAPGPSSGNLIPISGPPIRLPCVELKVSNMGADFNLNAHIDLKKLARNTSHVKYDRSRGHLEMQMRHPACFAKIFSGGKVVLFAQQNEIQDEMYEAINHPIIQEAENACSQLENKQHFTVNPTFVEEKTKVCARMLTRKIQKVVPEVKLARFRINNIFGTCAFPFGIRIEEMNSEYAQCSYEPELKSGMDWRLRVGDFVRGVATPVKGHMTMYHSGRATFTGFGSVTDLLAGLEFVYVHIWRFRGPIPEKSARAKNNLKRKNMYYEDLDDCEPDMNQLNFEDGEEEESESEYILM